MRRRMFGVAGGLIVLTLTGLAVVAAGRAETPASDPESSNTTVTATTGTATVERRTLEQTEELTGAIGYGEVFSLPAGPEGTVTWVPNPGTVLQSGDLLYRVDEVPTYWTEGAVPTYRELSRGTKGDDVTQLQRFLEAGGYLEADEVDGVFGTGTYRAVEQWQQDHKLERTGRVDAAQLLFLPYDVLRVATTQRVGEASGAGILEVTTAIPTVTVETSAAKKRAFESDPDIEVETADGSRFPATLHSTAAADRDASGTLRFTVELTPAAPAGQQPGEVTVRVTRVLATDVVVIPVRGLVALADGRFAVELVAPDGSTEYRAVEIGAFAGGWVEVTGEIEAGDEIVVPS